MIKLKKLIILAFTFALALSFSGCFFVESGNGSYNGGGGSNTVKITLHDGSYAKSFDVEVGSQAKIDELTKMGYYSTGYYTSTEGGEQYFDASGTSLSTWSSNYPTDFYVQYLPIEEFSKKAVFYSSNAKEFSYYEGAIVKLDPQFANAMKANLNKTLNVYTYFSAYDTKAEDWVVYYKNVAKYNEGSMTKDKIASQYYGYIIDVPSNYTNFSYSCNIPISKISNGDCLAFLYSRGANVGKGYIKNLTINITIS